ncbi:MAG: STN domain-containing protein [Segetibacter sp.]
MTVDAQSVSIEEFIKQVEQQSNYIFYYNPAQFDSFSVNVIAKQLPLPEILRFVFRNTDFFASMNSSNHVFLTKGQAILTELPSADNALRNDSLRRAGHLFNKESKALNNFADNKM